MIVQNNRSEKDAGLILVPIISGTGQVEKNLTLVPGNNFIPNDEWAKAEIHVKDMIASGIISVLEDKTSTDGRVKATPVNNITDILNIVKARAVIEETYNLETLKTWYEIETRGDIRNAIDDRIKFIMKDNGQTLLKKNRRS